MSFFARFRLPLTSQVTPGDRTEGDGDPVAGATDEVPTEGGVRRHRVRAIAGATATVLAALLVWAALVAPNELGDFRLGAFARLPLEALVIGAVLLFLPVGSRRVVAALVGVVLGVLTVVKIIDIGFFEALDRPFNPVTDWAYAGSAVSLLSDSTGRSAAIGTVVTAIVIIIGLPVLMMFAVVRLTRLAARHHVRSLQAVTALAVVWVLCAVLGAQFVPGAPVASTSAARLGYDQVRAVRAGFLDQRAFTQSLTADPFRGKAGSELLTGLRGKDVIVAFVESYGRIAVQGSAFSPKVDAVLDAGTKRLRADGFSARSAFLTSPTFGGISWLAHSTLQSGVWVNNQRRYDQLVDSDRFTLSKAFKRAGWRTVADLPADNRHWPQGTSFYHYDKVYDQRNVGYQGPRFGYVRVPDQYSLAALHRLELAKRDRPPLFTEIDLMTSHIPWAPLPYMIDWSQVGDGSAFQGMPQQGQTPDVVWRHASQVRAAYGQSIEYSLKTLVSFVHNYADDNLVLVVLGDHQPAAIVSGRGGSHDVPVSIIAHDPKVMDQISHWGWQDGLRPDPKAPVWPMSAFRDRFLTAYGPQAPSAPPQSASRAQP